VPENLYVRINRPLPLADLLGLAATKLKEMLRLEREPEIGTEMPRGATFSVVPSMIPDRPRWGLNLYLEDVDESLVEAHVSTLSAEAGESPTVLYFGELRTPASKALTAALAIAAADLLGTEILDLEHVWSNRAQIAADELKHRLTIPEPQADIQLAAARLHKKMCRQ
jgi:hypothetical protein